MIGRRFKINLSDKTWTQDEIPQDWVLRYAGGTGLALKAFHDQFTSTGEPGIMMAPGFLAGTNAPAGHWCSIVFYDPDKRSIVSSYCGGHWGNSLRLFGGALVEIQGWSPSMTVLVLEEGQVRFVDAGDLKGLNPREVCVRLENLLGHGYHIASVGLAGEMGVPIASLIFDGAYQRQSAGLGAALGRIGVKAVAVKGSEKIVPAIPQSFFLEARSLRKCFSQDNFPYRELSSYGSAWFLKELYQQTMLPIKNFTTSFFPHWEMLSGEFLADSFRRQSVACSGCPVGCRWFTPMGDGWCDGSELEEVIALGTLCGIANPKDLLEIKAYCDRLGIDPLPFGGALAAVMERGETEEGEPLIFGEGEKVLGILEEEKNPETALVRLGILSAGTRTLLRGPRWVGFMNTDPRADAHLALCRVAWPFDEPHVLGSGAFVGKLPLFDDRGEIDVAKTVQAYQDFYIGLQSLGFCPWTCLAFTPKGLDPLLRAALWDRLPDEAVLHFGRAAFSLESSGALFPKLDVPPPERFKKLAQEPIEDGPKKGQKLNIMQLWQDYLNLRDHAAVKSVSFGEGA